MYRIQVGRKRSHLKSNVWIWAGSTYITNISGCLNSENYLERWPLLLTICVIGKWDIFPLTCAADKVWITELTLIHKSIRSVRNSHAQELTLILKIIGQYDIRHILTSPIKTITPVLKILTYIITSITAPHVGLAAILAIMLDVSTFKTAIILY